jgi:hypothetical protein
MRWSSNRLLVLVAAIFLLYGFGVLVDADSLTRQAGTAAAVALLGYTAVATFTAPPRVRWPLLVGVAALALTTGANLFWPPEARGPRVEAGPAGLTLVPAEADLAPSMLGHARWTALGLLVTAGGLALALLGVPRQRRPWALLAALPLVALLLANTGGLLPSRAGGLGTLLGALWLPLLAAVASAGVAVLATQRGYGGWRDGLAFLGVALLALVALGHALVTANGMPSVPAPTDAFLTPGIRYSTANTVAPLAAEDALTALATLAAPLLVVAGLRRSQ